MENQVFNFSNHEVSVVIAENNEPMFVAKEVCSILEYADTEVALRKLDDDEKLARKLYVSGQNRNISLITESGLYSLVLRTHVTQKSCQISNFNIYIVNNLCSIKI